MRQRRSRDYARRLRITREDIIVHHSRRRSRNPKRNRVRNSDVHVPTHKPVSTHPCIPSRAILFSRTRTRTNAFQRHIAYERSLARLSQSLELFSGPVSNRWRIYTGFLPVVGRLCDNFAHSLSSGGSATTRTMNAYTAIDHRQQPSNSVPGSGDAAPPDSYASSPPFVPTLDRIRLVELLNRSIARCTDFRGRERGRVRRQRFLPPPSVHPFISSAPRLCLTPWSILRLCVLFGLPLLIGERWRRRERITIASTYAECVSNQRAGRAWYRNAAQRMDRASAIKRPIPMAARILCTIPGEAGSVAGCAR